MWEIVLYFKYFQASKKDSLIKEKEITGKKSVPTVARLVNKFSRRPFIRIVISILSGCSWLY